MSGPPRSPDERRAALQRGQEAEDLVAVHYERDGWRVLDRNLRIGGSELDLVVERAGYLRFVEVKLRAPGDPIVLETITADKQRRLVRGARSYLQHYDDVVEEATFDVAIVRFRAKGPTVEILEHAFDAG